MINLIPSKDVRNYIIETGRHFTDFEKAAILYHLEIPFYEKQERLQKIAKTTDDGKLKEQIKERIEMDIRYIDMFNKCNEGFVYAVVRHKYDEPDTCGYFASVDLAHKHGIKQGCRFEIKKFQIIGYDNSEIILPKGYWNPHVTSKSITECVVEMEYDGDAISVLYYDELGVLMDYASSEPVVLDNDLIYFLFNTIRFENSYIDIPNPFEKGDIVNIINTGEKGVVVTSQQEWKVLNKKMLSNNEWDFVDICINVEFIDEGERYIDHICHMYLERCE